MVPNVTRGKRLAVPTKDSAAVAEGPTGLFLTRHEFQKLAEVPTELEWFANIGNPRTRCAYEIDLQAFTDFAGIRSASELRGVNRAHVIAWRKNLELRNLTGATIRRKLAALSSLFDYLCERNAVVTNPVKGVKRPKVEGRQDTGTR
jgi:site-specific recombinase XerD